MEKVLVLMSTYNGEKHLAELLESLNNQKGVKITLLIRDDGSRDNTLSIIESWKEKMEILVYSGENLKPAKSFLNLIKLANNRNYKFYAFCDQDDIWMPEKLINAILKLKDYIGPALYIGSATLVDNDLKKVGEYKVTSPLTFSESLFRNNAQGATMVFNFEMLSLLNVYSPDHIYMHDSWVYQIALGSNAHIYTDDNSFLMYRQHSNNVVGAKIKITDKIKLRLKIWNSRESKYFDQAVELKKGYEKYFSDKNNTLLNLYLDYKNNYLSKVKLLTNPDIKIKGNFKRLLFIMDVFLNKL